MLYQVGSETVESILDARVVATGSRLISYGSETANDSQSEEQCNQSKDEIKQKGQISGFDSLDLTATCSSTSPLLTDCNLIGC